MGRVRTDKGTHLGSIVHLLIWNSTPLNWIYMLPLAWQHAVPLDYEGGGDLSERQHSRMHGDCV